MTTITTISNESALSYATSVAPQIEAIVSPLKNILANDVFCYCKVLENNSYLCLWNKITEFQKQYFMTINHQGPTYKSFIKSTPYNYTTYNLFPKYPARDDVLLNISYEHNLWHGLMICHKTQHYTEKFSFVFRRGREGTDALFLKSLGELNKFVDYFKVAAKHLIDCTDTNKLATYSTLVENDSLDTDPINAQQFLDYIEKQYKIIYSTSPLMKLTKQEYRCVEFLAQGKTAKEAGKAMKLSHRTVESYLRNVKDKTNLNYKSQVINMFHTNNSRYKND